MTGNEMYSTMNSMDDWKPSPKSLVPSTRTVQVGFRVSATDAEVLMRLARQEGVGHLTLARLIVERYLADHRLAAPTTKKRRRSS
jgi:hypothetical protein